MEYVKQLALGILTVCAAGAAINVGRKIPVIGGIFDFIHEGFDS